jgi:hypothetical protein
MSPGRRRRRPARVLPLLTGAALAAGLAFTLIPGSRSHPRRAASSRQRSEGAVAAPVAGTTGAPGRSARPGDLVVRRVGSLPAPVSRVAAVALPDGNLVVLGGLVGGSPSNELLIGPPSHLRSAGRLPVATHDAAAALAGGRVLLFGGGETVSTNAVIQVDPVTGSARPARSLFEPLSDLAAVDAGHAIYLVGGYTGTEFASAVLRVGRNDSATTVARLPAGLRYAGVAALGRRIYAAGWGRPISGPGVVPPPGHTDAILAIDPIAGSVRRIGRLPAPAAHAPLVALGGSLYLIGGRSSAGAALDGILRIDPRAGRVFGAGRLPLPLADAAAVSSGGHIVVLGGAGPGASAAVLELTPRR